MASIVKLYDTPFSSSNYVYDHIRENLGYMDRRGLYHQSQVLKRFRHPTHVGKFA